jgi:hypothetical protein
LADVAGRDDEVRDAADALHDDVNVRGNLEARLFGRHVDRAAGDIRQPD